MNSDFSHEIDHGSFLDGDSFVANATSSHNDLILDASLPGLPSLILQEGYGGRLD